MGGYFKGRKPCKEFAMKKRFLITLAVLVFAPLLAGGCMTYFNMVEKLDTALNGKRDIDKSTTIVYPDGSIIYASVIDQLARADADNKATSRRNVTQQQTQWVSTGAYDYEFNQGELKAGIAQGKYKLGEPISTGPQWHTSSRIGGSSVSPGRLVYPVLIPQTVNVTNTVTNVDQKLWQQTYAERLKYRRDWVKSKMMNTNVSPADVNASSTRIMVMKRLEERLREGLQPGVKTAPGTKLVYGGWQEGNYGGYYEQENVLVAYLDAAGAFVCEWHK
jgi:hypothetical protein